MVGVAGSEVFYVKLLMDGGRIKGHAVSPSREFPTSEKSFDQAGAEPASNLDERFSRHLTNFVDSMTVYTEFMPMVMELVPAFTGEMFKASMEAFLQKHANHVELVEDGKVFELDTNCYSDFVGLSANTKPTIDLITSLSRNVLMGLVALLDQHIRDVMRICLSAHPDWLEKAQSTMTMEQIFKFENLEQLRESSIEAEVDSLSRESRGRQVEWFEQKFKLDKISENYKNWPVLMEVCERRNLFPHTNGYVTEQYLARARECNYDVSNISVGQKLTVSKSYYKVAVGCIFEFGVMLSHVVRKKVMKDQNSSADEELGDLGFRLINRGDYQLAVRLLEFAYGLRGIPNERLRKTLAINYANALKLAKQKEKALNILK